MNRLQPTSRTRQITVALIAALLIALVAQPAAACPTCKQALADGSSGGDLVGGYFWSILFMMSMPFLILGSLSMYFYVQVRRARARQTVEAEVPQPSRPAVPQLAEA